MNYPNVGIRVPAFQQLEREINQMLGHLSPQPSTGRASGVYFGEDEAQVYIEAIAPGLRAEDIQVTFDQGVLEIRAARTTAPEGTVRTLHRERPTGEFLRKIKLAVPVSAEGIRAEYRSGILNIALPKSEAAKPRRIEVSSGQ